MDNRPNPDHSIQCLNKEDLIINPLLVLYFWTVHGLIDIVFISFFLILSLEKKKKNSSANLLHIANNGKNNQKLQQL